MFLNTTDPSELCAVRCDESITVQDDARDFFRETVKSAVMSHDFSVIGKLFDKEKLKPLCNVTATFVTCANNCPDKPWKGKMLAMYEPLIYMCHGSHFMEHVDCLHDVYNENKNACEEQERCQQYRQNAVSDIGLMTLALGGGDSIATNTTIKSLANHMCGFIECTNECRSPEIIAKCGKQANRELLLFYRRLVDTMKLVLMLYHRALTQQKETLVYDDHCDRIGAVPV
uniref:Uncharacterized protein n=1 Tax=Romanomermis culicivorax TaxID=13658 RepID=A0A915JYG8_ROMCU